MSKETFDLYLFKGINMVANYQISECQKQTKNKLELELLIKVANTEDL